MPMTANDPAAVRGASAMGVAGPLLEARELRKVYGSGASLVAVLDGVNLEVAAGEMIAIMGPSGAGKSTLLHLAAALDTPTSGTVYFESKALETRQDAAIAEFRNRKIGFVWQRHHLLSDFSAVENVAMPLLMRNIDYAQALKQAAGWLDEVGLASRARHQASELSGGEQQRVAIARALINQPKIILADEPTGNLDVATAAVVFDELLEMVRRENLAALIATHNPELAARMDRTVTLRDGKLVTLPA